MNGGESGGTVLHLLRGRQGVWEDILAQVLKAG